MGSVNNNRSLDEIGKQLIRRSSVGEADLASIVAKDDLFAGVMKRVATAEKVEVRKFAFGVGAAYASVSLAVAVIATLTIFTLMRTAKAPQNLSTAGVNVPANMPDTAVPQPVSPPQDETEVKVKLPAGGGDQRMIMADSGTSVPTPRRQIQRPVRPQTSDDNAEFYPISYGGSDTLAGGRIVRVDLPRAQAFAMGIHVPLENDSDTVRADVIVGPDGVPRAVRLVK
jgi:HAMP domain-containing protein